MNVSSRFLWTTGLLLSAATCLLFFTLTSSKPVTLESIRPAQVPVDDYVGADACQSCHADQHASWQASFHPHMTQTATPDAIGVQLDGLTVEVQGLPYSFQQAGDEIHVEMPDFTAKTPGQRITRRLALVTGSHHMHVFWTEYDETRTLMMLPIVYRLDEETWIPRNSMFLHPPGPISVEYGRWNTVCIRCHTTHPRLHCDPETKRCDPHVVQLGISCEACHGPGGGHAQARSKSESSVAGSPAANPDSIVNPKNLSHRRASDVCGQCHGFYGITANDEPTLWESGFSFRPGEDIHETGIRRIVTLGAEHDDPDVHEMLQAATGYQAHLFWPDGMIRVSGREYNGLVESPCYQRGEMSCLSCHTMHAQGWDAASRAEWANDQLKPGMRGNETCLQCHTEFRDDLSAHTHHAPGSTGSNCMNCHMPHTSYGLLKAIRSHEISSPAVETVLNTGRPVACNLCHLDRTLAWTAEHLEDWYGQTAPAIPDVQKTVSASVFQLLSGDAGERAVVAWAFGWKPAQETSGTDWMPVFLLETTNDPYDAVRQVAQTSLRTLPGFHDYVFDFTVPEEQRSPAIEAAIATWLKDVSPSYRSEVLYGDDGHLQRDRLIELLRLRNNRAVDLWE